MAYVCLDLDDYSDIRNGLEYLWRLRARFKDFKVTLWSVIGWSTPQFLDMTSTWGWAELGVHGYTHEGDEVQKWDELQARSYLARADDMGCFKRMFHSPGWGRSKMLMNILKEGDYIYQAHPKNERAAYFPENTPPEGLKVYYPGEEPQEIGKWYCYGLGWGQEELIDRDNFVLRVHGHTGNKGVTNGLDYLFPLLMSYPEDTKFIFISELFNE